MDEEIARLLKYLNTHYKEKSYSVNSFSCVETGGAKISR